MPLILTLDAGGTNLVFSAVQEGEIMGDPFTISTPAHDIDQFLNALINGFKRVAQQFDDDPTAISFAFPGPADYKNGVIGELKNIPAFRNNIALKSYLEKNLDTPVYINNDGDMFALGEAIAGFLPWINHKLSETDTGILYRNLVAVTLGTGFGAGVVINGKLLSGDTGTAAEAWLLRNKVHSYTNVEDILSTRAVKRMYAEQIHIDPAKAPEPEDIFMIASGKKEGVKEAATEAWFRFGEVLGDAIAQINTIVDGAVVIGGGLSGAYSLFKNTMMDELNGYYKPLTGKRIKRSTQSYFNIEDDYFSDQFFRSPFGITKNLASMEKVHFLCEKKTPVGLSKLGTNKAIALGCYYYAIQELNDL